MLFMAWAPVWADDRRAAPRGGSGSADRPGTDTFFPVRAARRFAPQRRRRYDLVMLSFLREFAAFLRAEKKYWLVPIVVVASLIGILFLAAKLSPTVAPFLYSFI